MRSRQKQAGVIQELFTAAEERGIPLWLESGWAVDARLGEITREHGDIDVAFPAEKRDQYIALLDSLGFGSYEELDYGFLMSRDDVLVDSEPCTLIEGEYTFGDFPAGSCPREKEGRVEGLEVRCVSWDAMYFEFLGYMEEVPRARWRERDAASLRVVQAHLAAPRQRALEQRYSIWKARARDGGESH